MRLILSLLFILCSTTALAEKYEVLSVKYYGNPTITMGWEANRPLGRAWLSVIVDTSMPDSSLGYDTYEQKVEGLRYDEVSKRIVLERDGKITECARFRKGSFFRVDEWVSTNCRLSYKLGYDMEDDGFRIFRRRVVKIYITTKE